MSILDIRPAPATRAISRQAVIDPPTTRESRRNRLERLAKILTATKNPVRLFETMESYPKKDRLALRAPQSALAMACLDPAFRREGLRGDTVGDAIAFFGLSIGEAHALLCDCGYGASKPGFAQNAAIAARARRFAARLSVREMVQSVIDWAKALMVSRLRLAR